MTLGPALPQSKKQLVTDVAETPAPLTDGFHLLVDPEGK